jgi:hypothetical protein
MKLLEIVVNPAALAAQYIKHINHDNLSQHMFGASFDKICSEAGNCSMISNHFYKWLNDRDVKSRVIVGIHAKDPSWPKNINTTPGSNEDAHTVVLIGNIIVDFTAKQFDKSLTFPRVIQFSKFKTEWDMISDEPNLY